MRTSEVRSAYVRHMRIFLETKGMPSAGYGAGRLPYDGGPQPRGRAKPSAWPELARVILSLGASPESYIKYHFSHSMVHAPTPYQLASIRSADEYRKKRMPIEASDISSQLANDNNEFRHWSKKNKPMFNDDRSLWRCVLLDTCSGENISPLFRYLVACSLGMTEVIEFWRTDANLQYSSNPLLYNQLWSGLIKPGYLHIPVEDAAVVDDLAESAAPPSVTLPGTPFNIIRA